MEGQLRTNIYEDVDLLKQQVIELQAGLTTVTSDVNSMKIDLGELANTVSILDTEVAEGKAKSLIAGTDLFTLDIGTYFIPTSEIAETILNKPVPNMASTAVIEILPMGADGQKMMSYVTCRKNDSTTHQTFFYQNEWGKWNDVTVTDTGWIFLPLNTGWSMGDYTTEVPRYRKIGNIVMVRGLVNATATAGTAIATLPVGFRPYMTSFARFACSLNQSQQVNIQVGANGIISDYSKQAGTGRTFIGLNGIVFSVD